MSSTIADIFEEEFKTMSFECGNKEFKPWHFEIEKIKSIDDVCLDDGIFRWDNNGDYFEALFLSVVGVFNCTDKKKRIIAIECNEEHSMTPKPVEPIFAIDIKYDEGLQEIMFIGEKGEEIYGTNFFIYAEDYILSDFYKFKQRELT